MKIAENDNINTHGRKTIITYFHTSLHLEFQGVFAVARVSRGKISERSALPQKQGLRRGNGSLPKATYRAVHC